MRIYVLAYRRATCHEAASRYEKEGFTVFEVTGEQAPDERHARCMAFKKCEDERVVLVGQIDALCMPVDIGRVDTISVIEEHPVSPQATLQAKNRATQVGQEWVN
jgi:hypothetical protein